MKMTKLLPGLLASLVLLTACGQQTGQSAEEAFPEADQAIADATEGLDEMANPWYDSDEAGVLEATGFDLVLPEGAQDVQYSYMENGGPAQASYTLDGLDWVYRMEGELELTDISGTYYAWEETVDGEVSYCPAVYCSCTVSDSDSEADGTCVKLVYWYDVVPGVAYSLCVSGSDLSDVDMQTYAENIFVPLQGDAYGDDETEADELNAYFLGEHVSSYDGSTLSIADNGDGTFLVDLDVYRLCSLEGGVGTFADHRISFTVSDPNGNEMAAVIWRDADNSLVVEITDSSWEYLAVGDQLTGF